MSSDRALRMLARVKEARRTHLQSHGREPSLDELVAATELSRQQVEQLIASEKTPRGLEEPLGDDGGGTYDPKKRKPNQPDPADWWKRGEEPPF